MRRFGSLVPPERLIAFAAGDLRLDDPARSGRHRPPHVDHAALQPLRDPANINPVSEGEQGPRHRFAGMPAWLSAGAAVVAAIAGIAFGFAQLSSSDDDSSTPPPSSAPATTTTTEAVPTVSPPRIVTVRRAPPPVVTASGTAANVPEDARIYLGVRTVSDEAGTPSGASTSNAAAGTSDWKISSAGTLVDGDGTWEIADFEIPASVVEPFEFFALARVSGGSTRAISNSVGSRGSSSCSSIRGCTVAESETVPYEPD
jgi:hypothetical protein